MSDKKEISPLGVFVVSPFGVQVSVFDDLDRLSRYHQEVIGGNPIEGLNPLSYGMCIKDEGPKGETYFYMYISQDADKYTKIHECSHLLDFIHAEVGVPFCLESTEVRAYGLAEACRFLDEVLA